jgi:type I restriction-modification system DNA methylase subunit
MKISNDVANVLANSKVDGQELYLPEGQLDRKLYMAVNKVLVAIGGKWSRKLKTHVFDCYPEYKIEEILLTGEYTDVQKEYQFFETPSDLAKRLVEMANIQPSESVLEPSTGRGAIAKYIKYCDCLELHTENEIYLNNNGFNLIGNDFLQFNTKYDVIIANPPFAPRQSDIDHITHMIKLANRCVVSVASASVIFRTNKKTEDFRGLVKSFKGTITPLPENSFAESGTKVNTCVVYIEK